MVLWPNRPVDRILSQIARCLQRVSTSSSFVHLCQLPNRPVVGGIWEGTGAKGSQISEVLPEVLPEFHPGQLEGEENGVEKIVWGGGSEGQIQRPISNHSFAINLLCDLEKVTTFL